ADTSVGAAIGLNVQDITNTATIGSKATVEGDGVTVEAITPAGKRNDFIVWGLAAAGGKGTASVAASAAVQVLFFHTTASVGQGATITSHEDMTVNATDFLGMQNITLAGGLSTSGTAVGGSISVNVL